MGHHLLQLEVKQVVVRMNICYYPHSDIIIIRTLNTMILDLTHDRLFLESTFDDQSFHKTGRITAAVWPPLSCKKSEYIGLFVIPSYLLSFYFYF